jgi:hypothetical protein
MVPSSALTVATDGDRLMCGGLSLSDVVRHGSFEFIADYFSDLSLSPRRGDLGPTFMGSTHSVTPSLCQAMIEVFPEEVLTTSSGEGGSSLSSPRRHGTGGLLALVIATPWMENTPVTHAMMMVLQWTAVPQPDISLPFEQRRAH